MIKRNVKADLTTAMKEKDEERKSALRLLLAALTQAEKEKGQSLDEGAQWEVVAKQVKQAQKSIEEYERLNQAEAVARLQREIAVYQHYLPPQLEEATLRQMIEEAVQVSGAVSAKDMGKVMGLLTPRIKGRADARLVSQLVRDRLATS